MLPNFSKFRVLVIGDVMLDHYIWGDATRISPEAPVPVVSVERDSFVPGGAANVACNLAGLGVETRILGSYGPDEGGNRLGAMLSEQGIGLDSLGCRGSVSTIVKTRVLVQRQQMCRIDREGLKDGYEISSEASIQKLISDLKPNAVVISDYAKGVITDSLLITVRDSVRALGQEAFIAMDPKPRNEVDLSCADIITPNRAEALELAQMRETRGAIFDGTRVCRKIYQRFGIDRILVTLGADGMLLCEGGRVTGNIPAQAREVFDVSGAGDTVIAVLTAGMAIGMSFEEAAILANSAAGVVVGHLGTVPVRLSELCPSH